MTRREPSDEAILAARLQRAYPSLSPYSSASLAQQLCAIERMQRKHATRLCSGPPDVRQRAERGELFGYVKAVPLPEGRSVDPTAPRGMTWQSDEHAEERAEVYIKDRVNSWRGHLIELAHGIGLTDSDPLNQRKRWAEHDVELHGDPRGAVLKVRLPGEAEAVSV